MIAAVMLVKDEADIIRWTIDHLLRQVDRVHVIDNMSSDGTDEAVREFADRGLPVTIELDETVGYLQDEKTTRAALLMRAEGFEWVLPCDADEFWYVGDGRPLRDYVDGLAPDVTIVRADLYNHIPTGQDGKWPNPFQRFGWRLRERAPLGKVCVRTHPDMRIQMGNHSAWLPGTMSTVSAFVVRHYSWRSEDQYVRKIVNGAAAYAATSMPPTVGEHWRMFGNPPDEGAVRQHFRQWFYSAKPRDNPSLIYDPAPGTVSCL